MADTAFVAFIALGGIGAAFDTVPRLGGAGLTAALALASAGVVNRGLQTRRAYRAASLPIGLNAATAVAAAAYGGNKVTKSGGLVGLAVHLADGRRRSLDPVGTAAAYVVISIAGGAATLGLAGLAGLTMAGPRLAVLVCAVAVAVLGSSRRGWRASAVSFGSRRVSRLVSRIGDRWPVSVDPAHLLTAFGDMRTQRRHLAAIAAHGVVGKLVGVATLHVVLHSLGVTHISPDATLRLYTLALLSAALGPLPAGLGTAEASMTAVMVAAGIDAQTAVGATVLFRLFDVWLPVLLAGLAAPFVMRRTPASARRQTTPAEPAPTDTPSGARLARRA